MKKILLIVTAVVTLSGLTAFGQGNWLFQTGARFVWNDLSAPPAGGGAFNVAFLWSSSLTATSAVSGFHTLTPTNNILGGGTQGSHYDATPNGTAEWNAILSDPNFQLGREAAGNTIAVGTLTATGGVNYSGGTFGVAGSSLGGGSAMVFLIAWSNAFATPALAAAGNSPLGWSGVFRYDYANNTTQPTSIGTQAVLNGPGDAHFGVIPVAVPEPTTFCLAGLGAAAMLIFRRRK
jgi:hypothetical protein